MEGLVSITYTYKMQAQAGLSETKKFSVQESAVGLNVLYKRAEKTVTDLLLYKWDLGYNITCAVVVPVCEQMDTKIFSAQWAKA